MEEHYFKDVTLLITHYNRSGSLERLLKSFKTLRCNFEEIVVSDDGSNPEHLKAIDLLRSSYNFRLITTPQNKGLGNNINKGQDPVTTPYTLYIQEDFVPKPAFVSKLQDSVEFIKTGKFDIIRFYAYFKYPYLKPYKSGFSEMKFNVFKYGYRKFYLYSDHPHLRKSDFFEKFGRYREGLKVEATEYQMMFSFLKNKGTGLFYDDITGLFDQENSSEEPSTVQRNVWRNSGNLLITGARHLYRHLRFNFDYFF